VAQLDGQVAYLPDTGSNTSYVILFEDRVAQTHAIRFSPGQTAIIDPFIKHSLPIPMFGGAFEFIAWHRAVSLFIL
jgi:hypothetical protein